MGMAGETIDSCQNCRMRGDLKACLQTPCVTHHSWFAQQMLTQGGITLEAMPRVPVGVPSALRMSTEEGPLLVPPPAVAQPTRAGFPDPF